MQATGSVLVPPMGRGMISSGPALGHPMAQPQSLLAELRALESKRAQGGLSPPEELRLAELRAVAGQAPAPAAGPRGFDVNAAAALLREELPPVALPPPAPASLPEELAPAPAPIAAGAEAVAEPDGVAPPEDVAAPAAGGSGASALGEVPADWSSWQEPEAGEAQAAPPEEQAASGWDPAVEAAWEAYARERGWDPEAPWDEATAASHWDGFLRSMGWVAAPAEGAAEPPAAPEAPAPAKENDTASWDLGSVLPEPGTAPAGTAVPDERDPGVTAQWSLAQVTGASAPAAAAFQDQEPEPALLDELQLESQGSFGDAAPAAEPPPAAAPPPAPAPTPAAAEELAAAPVEVSDDEIIEVGDDAFEVAEVPAEQPAGPRAAPGPSVDELPVLEAVELTELVEEPPPPPPAPVEPPPEPLALEPVPPEPAAEPAPPPGEPVPLESLTIDEEPLVEEPAAPRGRLVPGLHRVVLHTVEGQVMRGLLQDPDLLASAVALSAQPDAPPEPVTADRLRAIFFMLAPGEKAPEPQGLKVRVTFRDGRQVAGFSRDYDPEAPGFFMIPAESRTNTARIWVYRSAVRQVSVS